jgi:hypothetical protein
MVYIMACQGSEKLSGSTAYYGDIRTPYSLS